MTNVKRILVALVAATTIVVGFGAAPASASTGCINHVTHSTSWGSIKVCIAHLGSGYTIKLTTDDLLTDGYCVHGEIHVTAAIPQVWAVPGYGEANNMGTSESCGPVRVTNEVAFADITAIRLVRGPATGAYWPPSGNGVGVNYLTAWPD